MRQFEGIASAADAVREFYYSNKADLPEHVTTKVQPYVGTGSSPVDLIVNFTEAVYANSGDRRGEGEKDLPAEGLEIAAGCAQLINVEGFHGRLDDRAHTISLALRRDSGEKAATGAKWPAADKDPTAKPEFAKPAEPESPEVPGDQPARPDQ